MGTFASEPMDLRDLLRDIRKGLIQLPDFQRGWVWDDDHIRDLLVSISNSFPIGAVMLLENGGEVRFQTRPLEGVEKFLPKELAPDLLILDGQQRLTTLTQAIALDEPVKTRTNKNKPIKRYYYFDIQKMLLDPQNREEAVISIDETRQLRSNFGRDIELDLSSRELECQNLFFPANQILDWSGYLQDVYRFNPEKISLFLDFQREVIDAFLSYKIPVIRLNRDNKKEAVCIVFEKVNTGGVSLSVFELVTASFAAEDYNLRDDWFGSTIRNIQSRKDRIEQDELLAGTEPTEFLQALTLLFTLRRKRADIADGRTGKLIRPVSAKRASVLELPLDAYREWADALERGFKLAGRFLKREAIFRRKELPYTTQVVPLAAVLTLLEERWLEPRIYQKLSQWYWCGVLGELYGGAVETRIANDLEELIAWFEDDSQMPRTVRDASFQSERLDSLRSRQSAAYKGINVLMLREGAQDWFWKAGIQELDTQDVNLDIHHIFPRAWCAANGIPSDQCDSILNKTPLSYKANRKIGGEAPSVYLRRIQQHEQVRLEDHQMDRILETHALNPLAMRRDDFMDFTEGRRQRLLSLISSAMGKAVEPDY